MVGAIITNKLNSDQISHDKELLDSILNLLRNDH